MTDSIAGTGAFLCAEAETIAPRIAHESLSRLLADWSAVAARGRLPRRADFSPESLRYILGNLILFDIEPGAEQSAKPRYRYRLFGSNFTFQRGYDLTGRYLDDLSEPNSRERWLYGFRRMTKEATPLYTRLRSRELSGVRLEVEALTLPLADDQGRVVKLLHGQFNRPLIDAELDAPREEIRIRCAPVAELLPMIEEARLVRLLAEWDEWRGRRLLPAWSHARLAGLHYLVNQLFLLDAEAGEPRRFRYRLFARSAMAERGVDLTGRYLDEHPDSAFAAQAQRAYMLAAAERQPLWADIDSTGSRFAFRFEGLVLPLAADGENCDRMLAAQIIKPAE